MRGSDREKADSEKRKPGRPQERVSLKPLEFEEALADLLATPPPAQDRRDTLPPAKRKGARNA